MSFFDRIKEGLRKTKESTANSINNFFSVFREVDEDLLEELEEALILADIGGELSVQVVDELRTAAKRGNLKTEPQVKEALCDILVSKMSPNTGLKLETTPALILVVGVNGVGKTTSIGKLGEKLGKQGKKVLFAAADTFRAAAADQLTIWAQRCGADIVRHAEGADPAAVIFDAISAGKARGADVIICDTAGRLHNKANLMQELAKMDRVIQRELPGADRETLLVVDATTGQNAVLQADAFNEACHLSGLILTKLDGTAKGGIAINLSARLGVPVKYIGVGEKAEDLLEFNAADFVKAFFE